MQLNAGGLNSLLEFAEFWSHCRRPGRRRSPGSLKRLSLHPDMRRCVIILLTVGCDDDREDGRIPPGKGEWLTLDGSSVVWRRGSGIKEAQICCYRIVIGTCPLSMLGDLWRYMVGLKLNRFLVVVSTCSGGCVPDFEPGQYSPFLHKSVQARKRSYQRYASPETVSWYVSINSILDLPRTSSYISSRINNHLPTNRSDDRTWRIEYDT